MNDIEKLIHAWRSHVEEYASARAEYEYLKEFRKSKKAILMCKYEEEGVKVAATREAKAYADPEYLELLHGLRTATEKAESLRYRMMIAQTRVDVWRTQEANNRRERNNYGA